MVKNKSIIELLDSGKIKSVHIVIISDKMEYLTFSCKISKVIKSGDDIILKLKTGKDYPLGHKYIFRSMEEVV